LKPSLISRRNFSFLPTLVWIRAILSQIQDDKEVVIAYSSKHLNAAERNFSAIEREALAMVYGIKRYYHYLQDDQFEIICDHRPMVRSP
jgi:hypothetical protein